MPGADSDGRDEAVAATRQGFDEPGAVGGIAERRPQLRDGDVEAPLEVDEGLITPQPSPQFVTRHELARMLNEYRQQLKRLVLEPDLDALFPKLASSKSALKTPKWTTSPVRLASPIRAWGGTLPQAAGMSVRHHDPVSIPGRPAQG